MHVIKLKLEAVQSLGQGGSLGKIVSTVFQSGSVDFLSYHIDSVRAITGWLKNRTVCVLY